jgi:hypothetical protein
MLGESCLETPKASMHKLRALARALCLASAVSLLWFLYWIGYDIVVWNKPLFRAGLFNYVGAILSSAIFLAGSRLATVKNMVDIPEKKENEELANVLEQGSIKEQGDAEKKDNIAEKSNEDVEPLPVLQELKTEENSTLEQKEESAVVLRERLRLERKEEIEIEMRRGLQTLKDELIELRHQYEELITSLKATQ